MDTRFRFETAATTGAAAAPLFRLQDDLIESPVADRPDDRPVVLRRRGARVPLRRRRRIEVYRLGRISRPAIAAFRTIRARPEWATLVDRRASSTRPGSSASSRAKVPPRAVPGRVLHRACPRRSRPAGTSSSSPTRRARRRPSSRSRTSPATSPSPRRGRSSGRTTSRRASRSRGATAAVRRHVDRNDRRRRSGHGTDAAGPPAAATQRVLHAAPAIRS